MEPDTFFRLLWHLIFAAPAFIFGAGRFYFKQGRLTPYGGRNGKAKKK